MRSRVGPKQQYRISNVGNTRSPEQWNPGGAATPEPQTAEVEARDGAADATRYGQSTRPTKIRTGETAAHLWVLNGRGKVG